MDVFTRGEWLDRRKDRWLYNWIYDWMYNFCSSLLYAALLSLVVTVYDIAKHANILFRFYSEKYFKHSK